MSSNYEEDNEGKANKSKNSATRRAFLQAGAGGIGVFALLDAADNGGIDGSILSGGGGSGANGGEGGFSGGYANNDNSGAAIGDETSTPRPTDEPAGENYESTERPRTETEPRDTPEPTDSPTERPTDSPTESPTQSPTDSPTETATRTETPGGLSSSCDRMYIQDDGTVVGLDLEDKEYRVFPPKHFPANSELTGLYSDLKPHRGLTELPDDLGKGVRASRSELFDYSVEAYDDMADESEWDTIWDESKKSSCSYDG